MTVWKTFFVRIQNASCDTIFIQLKLIQKNFFIFIIIKIQNRCKWKDDLEDVLSGINHPKN